MTSSNLYPASSDDYNSDHDSFIDMYAHVEQRTRTTQQQRREPDKCSTSQHRERLNVVHDNDTKRLGSKSSKASKNESLLPRRSNHHHSGLLGSFLESDTTAQPKRSSRGNRSYFSAPTVISYPTPSEDNQGSSTGPRKRNQDSSTSRHNLSKDSDPTAMMASRRSSTSSQQDRTDPGKESLLSSARGTRTTSSTRRSLTGSSSTDRTRSAESSRSLRRSSSSRKSARASTSSASNPPSQDAPKTSTHSSRYTSSSRQPTNRASLSRTAKSARVVLGDSDLDAKLKEIHVEHEEQRKRSQEIKRQVNRHASFRSRSAAPMLNRESSSRRRRDSGEHSSMEHVPKKASSTKDTTMKTYPVYVRL